MAATDSFTRDPSTMRATSRKSSMRALVHEPMNTRSSSMSVIFSPPLSPMYSSERAAERRLDSSAISEGSGTRPVTDTTCSGLVPQVTSGGRAAASSLISRSKWALSSDRSVSQ
jgi:hypothetical protein